MHHRIYFSLAMLLAAVISCSSPPAEEESVPLLRIGHAPHDHHAPLYIAAMNPDYFKKNGNIYLQEISFKKKYELVSRGRKLAVVVIDSSTGGNELVRRLTEDLADLSFGGVPAMLSFIDQGFPLRILLPVNSDGAGLVVAPEMAADNWAQFVALLRSSDKPVKIGYKSAVSVQNLIFETALKSESIAYDAYDSAASNTARVQLVNLNGPKNLIPALQNGLIDGFVIMQPFVALAEQQKVGKVIAQLSELPPAGKWLGTPCCAVAGNEQYVRDNPEVVEAMLTLLLRASRRIGAEPETSARQVARWLGTSEEVEMLSLPTIAYTTEFDDNWQRGVSFWVESLLATGKLNKAVKEAHDHNRFVERVYDRATYEKARRNLE